MAKVYFLTLPVAILACLVVPAYLISVTDNINAQDSSNTQLWAVEVQGGPEAADSLARELNMVNLGQIGGLNNYYHFTLRHDSRRSKRSVNEEEKSISRRMAESSSVVWFEQQRAVERSKRDFLDLEERDYVRVVQNEVVDKRDVTEDHRFNDLLYKYQWYIHDTRSFARRDTNNVDLAVKSVWDRGITGKGVVVSIVDDGLEWNHTDIYPNYAQCASHDVQDFDKDPFPGYDSFDSNRHGTRCAGEVAMVANNGQCGVGVAYNAKIGGIRLLDGKVTDSKEAAALSHNTSCVDIFSSSWGPTDNGRTMEKPGKLTSEAILTGIQKGRNGLGVLYVFASGNGGAKGDNCNCDGYVSSIYALSISSTTSSASVPYYAESCSSTLATAHSSGAPGEPKIVTTDLHNKCTNMHGGTSASAPLAAGIFALLLERNPRLTWRDVKHIVVYTAQYQPLKRNPGWFKNGVGFWVNDAFGFGLLNAEKMIEIADPAVWKTVPTMRQCEIKMDFDHPHSFGPKNPLIVDIQSNGCKGDDEREINYIEHVVLHVSLNYSRRGDVEVVMRSPMNTSVTMLRTRRNDDVKAALDEWPLTSIQNWGETPRGVWTVTIQDSSVRRNEGVVRGLKLVFFGTKETPEHVKRLGQRTYKREVADEEVTIIE